MQRDSFENVGAEFILGPGIRENGVAESAGAEAAFLGVADFEDELLSLTQFRSSDRQLSRIESGGVSVPSAPELTRMRPSGVTSQMLPRAFEPERA